MVVYAVGAAAAGSRAFSWLYELNFLHAFRKGGTAGISPVLLGFVTSAPPGRDDLMGERVLTRWPLGHRSRGLTSHVRDDWLSVESGMGIIERMTASKEAGVIASPNVRRGSS